jgi:putative DNA primase/helicase
MDRSSPEARLAARGVREEEVRLANREEVADFSDDALALAFSEQHAAELVHVALWGHWLRWDGTRWAKDETLAVFDLVRAHCRAAAWETAQQKDTCSDGPATC